MILTHFQQVQVLTTQAIELAESGDIIECNKVLASRHALLELVSNEVLPLKDDTIKAKFIELLLWVKNQDNDALNQVSRLKKIQKEKLMTQAKTSHALSQYKNVY